MLHAPCVKEIDIVYDSYLEDSIKECKRILRRSTCEPLEFINLKTTTLILVQMGHFWTCGKNKEAIQEISCDFFKSVSSKIQHRKVVCHLFRRHETLHRVVLRRSADMSSSRFD